MKELNKEQEEVVESIEGPVLVVAGPGSGKTEILSRRICNILEKTDIGPSGILALTFTDSACINMRERLASFIGASAHKVGIYTFHSFCTDIISKYPQYFFDSFDFSPADDLSRFEIFSSIFQKMDYKNPLNSKHNDKYVFIDSCIKNIAELKKAGIDSKEFIKIVSKNEKDYKKINKYLNEFLPQKISKKEIPKLEKLLDVLSKEETYEDDILMPSVFSILKENLREALMGVTESSTASLSEFKSKFCQKDDDGLFILKDFKNLEKNKALAVVYKEYEELMYKKGLFDFEDMILLVLKAMENNKSLVSDLEERFQYILVDEFQDTNNAQMKILSFLTKNPVNEGRPNIMVVGDDDQAIYKFQGAEVDNILNFKKMYKDVKVITLTKNYRSSQKILDISNSLIEKSSKSLRHLLPDIKKEIVSVKEFANTKVNLKIFQDDLSEFMFVSKEINKLLSEGFDPNEIAIISRKHQTLSDLSVVLSKNNIKFKYEKDKNIFEDKLVNDLINIIYFIDSLLNKDKDEADNYLPKILSLPFWNIKRKSIWQIGEISFKEKRRWLDVMLSSEDLEIKKVAEFLLGLAVFAKNNSFDKVIDKILGNSSVVLDEDDNFLKETGNTNEYTSPFRSFYTKDVSYTNFLSALSVFVKTLREYKRGQILSVSDVVSFVDTYKQNDIALSDKSIYGQHQNAVSLLTAHKSKGLEFKVVFVLNANHSEWVTSGRASNLKLPINIKVNNNEDDLDDKIRLFYVAVTRAKEILYITRHQNDYKGKEKQAVGFIEHLKDKFEEDGFNDFDSILSFGETVSDLEFSPDEKEFLKSLVKDYKMSPTHLNNFLDVSSGGPKTFLENNLLRFPEAKSVSAVYGTAIHKVMEFAHNFYQNSKKLPKIKDIKEILTNQILLGRFSKSETNNLIEEGLNNIEIFLEKYKYHFDLNYKIEVDFRNQGVALDSALLTGKIDKIIFNESGVTVLDWKTGKSKDSFEGGSDEEKISKHKYKQQLIFYKILLENSIDFSKYKLEKAVLFFLKNKNGQFDELELIASKEEQERLEKLIKIVYQKIVNIDFPDTEKYSKDFKGIMDFENDLLS
jgi:DNA helicase-2/ATP-dependent DNA helicase PcrA